MSCIEGNVRAVAHINKFVATLMDDPTTSIKSKYGDRKNIIKNKSRKTWDSF